MDAYENRLDHTFLVLNNYNENLTKAESQIRDTDMAQEITEYTKNSIILQSAQNMLIKANLMPDVYKRQQYGSQYVSQRESEKKASGKIQDAHEAIRPTNIALTPTQVKESLSRDQFRLYQLIWKRFAASRMAAAVYETTSVKIGAEGVQFTMTASRVKFDGFMSVYMEADDKEEKNQLLAKLEKGQELELVSLEAVSYTHLSQALTW